MVINYTIRIKYKLFMHYHIIEEKQSGNLLIGIQILCIPNTYSKSPVLDYCVY